jgi:hypothetical protein
VVLVLIPDSLPEFPHRNSDVGFCDDSYVFALIRYNKTGDIGIKHTAAQVNNALICLNGDDFSRTFNPVSGTELFQQIAALTADQLVFAHHTQRPFL